MPSLTLDSDLEPLIPGYLERRQEDLATLQSAISDGDFSVIQGIGHNLKGSGAGYGFDDITDIGDGLELAGKASDAANAMSLVQRLGEYLQSLDIRYEAM